MLTGLWLVSLFISGLALTVILGLVVARRIGEARAGTRDAERRRLVPLLLGAKSASASGEDSLLASDLLADIFTELIQMVRGNDKANFVASSSRLGVPARLRHRLDHGSARIRLAAAEALGDFNDEHSLARLEAALDDPHADVRLSAALALAEAGHAPPARLLVDRLGIGTSETSMLVVGLFQEIAKEKPEEIKALIEDDDVPPSAKAAAIDALRMSGDYTLVPLIARLVLASDTSVEELPRYLRALGEFGHPAAAQAVEHALGSETWWVRAAAAEAAGRIVLTGLAPKLAALLEDADWWVRFRAGEALVRLGEPGRLLLVEAARGPSELARSAASRTLTERGLAG